MARQLTRRKWRIVCLILAALAWPQMAAAQTKTPNGEESLVLRTYEVGDLVLDIHDYPYSDSLQRNRTSPGALGGGGGGGVGGGGFGGGGGGGGGFFSVPDAAVGTVTVESKNAAVGVTIDDLIDAIQATVAPDTWADSGGGEANIRPLGTVLVILQTPSVHDRIRDLLLQIRTASSDRRTMTIDARWLLLTSDDLDSLVLPDQQGVPEVDRKRLAEFTRRPGSIRGITSCFSGQLVYIVSGTRQNVVSSYIPVVGSLDAPNRSEQLASERRQSLVRLVSDRSAVLSNRDSQVGYQPVIEKPNFGALLEIRPTQSPSNGQSPGAIVDLKSTITAPAQPQSQRDGIAQAAGNVPVVDRIAIETQEFATTLRMPLGKPILVGGLTYAPPSEGQNNPTGEQAAAEEKPQLYLVLEVQ